MAMTTFPELAIIDEGEQLLRAAASLEEIKSIRDRAELARVYARTAREGIDLQNRAARLRLQAERKAGRYLADLRLRGGDRRSKHRQKLPKLAQIGITKHQSQRWQLLASIPEKVFLEYIEATIQRGQEVAAAPLLRVARQQHTPQDEAGETNGEDASGRFNGQAEGNDLLVALPVCCVSEMCSHCQIILGLLQPGATAGERPLTGGEIRHIRHLVHEIAAGLNAAEPKHCTSPSQENES